MHDFTDFPLAKFHEIWTKHVDRWSDECFLNRILKISCKVSFFQKMQKIEIFSYVLWLKATITPQWL